MARNEENGYLLGAIEALLFVSDEPVSAARLANILQVEPGRADELLQELQREYEEDNRGMQLREVAGGWRFYSHPAYHELIESYILSWDTRKMSQAALEALAVIAYHQPVTRSTVNAIRGVSSDGVISSLVEKGFVKEVGREKSAGSAILYGTTRAFLEKFGLKSIKDLPPLEDFAPDEATRDFIRQRLSGVEEARAEFEESASEQVEQESLQVTLVDEGDPDGAALVQEVDRGADEREDDPDAMAAIIAASMTEKAEFPQNAAEIDEPAEGEGEGA